MKLKGILLLALASTQLTGCMAVLEGLSALGQAEMQNPQPVQQAPIYPLYPQPQVVQPQISSPADHYYCNTIGYVTTCKKI